MNDKFEPGSKLNPESAKEAATAFSSSSPVQHVAPTNYSRATSQVVMGGEDGAITAAQKAVLELEEKMNNELIQAKKVYDDTLKNIEMEYNDMITKLEEQKLSLLGKVSDKKAEQDAKLSQSMEQIEKKF